MQCIILSVHMHLKGLGIQFVLATFQRIAKHLEVGRAANPYFSFQELLLSALCLSWPLMEMHFTLCRYFNGVAALSVEVLSHEIGHKCAPYRHPLACMLLPSNCVTAFCVSKYQSRHTPSFHAFRTLPHNLTAAMC